jgi:hypothetical protein
MKNNQKGSRKAKAKGNIHKDHSIAQEQKEQAVDSTLKKILEDEVSTEQTVSIVSPKILDKKKSKKKKVAKKKVQAKAKKKKANGSTRMKERAEMIIQVSKEHGATMKRLHKKFGKVRPIVQALAKHGIKESTTYQALNYLGLISTGNAQKKLAKMKEAGYLK